jgi:hypothetical protein
MPCLPLDNYGPGRIEANSSFQLLGDNTIPHEC